MGSDDMLLEILQTTLLLIWPHLQAGNQVSGKPTGWYCLLKNDAWILLPSKVKTAYERCFVRLVCSAGGGGGKGCVEE